MTDEIERAERLRKFEAFADAIEERIVKAGAGRNSEVRTMKKATELLFRQSGGNEKTVTDQQITQVFRDIDGI